MREYGQVQCAFWSDPDIASLSDDGRLLAIYLLTCSHSNGLGCYRLPDGYVQADLGWVPERVSKAFQELFEIGFSKRCKRSFFVLIPKFLKWNPIQNGNVAKARINEFRLVSENTEIFNELVAALLKYGNHWPKDFETLLKGYGKQDPIQPEPIRPNSNTPPPARAREAAEPPKTTTDPPVAPPPKPPRATTKTAMPAEFSRAVSARVLAWATKRGYDRLQEHLEAFTAKAQAKGYRYADWDAALMEAIREDWAGLREERRHGNGNGGGNAGRKSAAEIAERWARGQRAAATGADPAHGPGPGRVFDG